MFVTTSTITVLHNTLHSMSDCLLSIKLDLFENQLSKQHFLCIPVCIFGAWTITKVLLSIMILECSRSQAQFGRFWSGGSNFERFYLRAQMELEEVLGL